MTATDWQAAVDAHITRCPGCGGWQFDGACRGCSTQQEVTR